jgi:hypothetical protein
VDRDQEEWRGGACACASAIPAVRNNTPSTQHHDERQDAPRAGPAGKGHHVGQLSGGAQHQADTAPAQSLGLLFVHSGRSATGLRRPIPDDAVLHDTSA